MTVAVLDASALLALLLGEPGAEKVERLLANSAMSVINLAEVVGHFARNGVRDRDIRETLDPLPFERVASDEVIAYEIGLLLPLTKAAGLSLGDRACLALARERKVKAVTADRTWEAIARKAAVEIEVIR